MDTDIRELAKTNVLLAMRKEIEINQLLIDNSVLYRNTARHKKVTVLIAMARNNVLRSFLNFDSSKQTPKRLKYFVPMNKDYDNLVNEISATSYARKIKIDSEKQLYTDYTHADYKRKRVFLDVVLPDHPKLTKFVDILAVTIKLWWIPVVALFVFIFWFNESNSSSSSFSSNRVSSNENGITFGTGGVIGGNANGKSVSDIPQVKDNSKLSGFGNGGKSGHDATNSVKGVTNVTSDSSSGTTLPSDKPYNLLALYFLPDSYYGNLIPKIISSGDSLSVLSGHTILLKFWLPMDSGAIYMLNGSQVKALTVDSEISYTWFKFIPKSGMNNLTVNYKGIIYYFHFQSSPF